MSPLALSVMLSPSAQSSHDDIQAFARHVEQVGLSGVFVGDHLAGPGQVLDSPIVLGLVASATQRVQIGFAVMVLALRGPVWAAKQIATLQAISDGRLVLGVGVGADAHGAAAWQALGIPFSERGRRTDAALRVLPSLVTGAASDLGSGDRLQLGPGTTMPPLWVGGASPAAQRRAVQFGGTWFPSMVLADDLAAARQRLSTLAAEHNRAEPNLAVGGVALLGPTPAGSRDELVQMLSDGYRIPVDQAERLPITGSVAQAADRLHEFSSAGADQLVLGIVGPNWRAQCDLLAQAHAELSG
jgi:alkanesulfonate monooxygenase SsuD/methylene tetrahydromethanopterin reductase-like flavin-dependent oxidoreductase (luciferase family)